MRHVINVFTFITVWTKGYQLLCQLSKQQFNDNLEFSLPYHLKTTEFFWKSFPGLLKVHLNKGSTTSKIEIILHNQHTDVLLFPARLRSLSSYSSKTFSVRFQTVLFVVILICDFPCKLNRNYFKKRFK